MILLECPKTKTQSSYKLRRRTVREARSGTATVVRLEKTVLVAALQRSPEHSQYSSLISFVPVLSMHRPLPSTAQSRSISYRPSTRINQNLVLKTL